MVRIFLNLIHCWEVEGNFFGKNKITLFIFKLQLKGNNMIVKIEVCSIRFRNENVTVIT